MRRLAAALALIASEPGAAHTASRRGCPRPLAAAAAILVLLLAAPSAGAAIGRADLGGSGVEQAFVEADAAFGVAVDRGHIYWTDLDPFGAGDAIGRAAIDGADADPSFIVGVGDPGGIAVSGGHIYWANTETESIARANLDGTGVELDFIPDTGFTTAVAVDSSHVYWGWDVGLSRGIGRANLDGSGVVKDFIDAGPLSWGVPRGLAVDADHIYWSAGVVIGRADIDGGGVIPVYLTPCLDPGQVSNCSASSVYVAGVAVDDSSIYFSGTWPPDGHDYVYAIGRADLDGSGLDLDLVTTSGMPWALATGTEHLYWAADSVTSPPTIGELIETVKSLGLGKRTRQGLLGKLRRAEAAVETEHMRCACRNLKAFVNRVTRLSGTKIDPADADGLIADAGAIRDSLGCNPGRAARRAGRLGS